jgi:hypothetical protein
MTSSYVRVAKVRERQAVSKQANLKFDVERFKTLNEVEGKVQYQVKISKRFAASGNFNMHITRAWVTIKENSQINAYDLNNVRCEASRHFRNKREYPKDKINDLTTYRTRILEYLLDLLKCV